MFLIYYLLHMALYRLNHSLHVTFLIYRLRNHLIITGIEAVNNNTRSIHDIEWNTLIFFAGLFIMVGALVNVGALADFANFLKELFGGDTQLAATSILGISAVLSGVIDNIPFVASMSPVVSELSVGLVGRQEHVLWWSLAFGADFGGNATIIGASANVVAIGLAAKAGIKISFWKFAKYGILVTAISVAMVYPYLLLFYF